MGKKLLVVVAVLALIVVGAGVWYFVINDDGAEKATAECDPAPCEASTVESIDGAWTVADASEATLSITETIGGIADHEAVGELSEVTGELTVEGEAVTAADLTVDVTALEFTDSPSVGDVGNREVAMRNTGLQTEEFPEATFALTAPIELGEDITSGETVTSEATGDLTLHGVTMPITFSVDVVADGDTFRVVPTEFIPIVLEDYEMDVSAPGFVADISDEGSFDFELVLEQA